MSNVVRNIKNVGFQQNELVTQHSWNRNFLRLLENDEDLKALFDDTRALVGITDNDPTKKYQPGDLVWYSGHDPDGVPNIYLLVNLIPDNYGMPQGVSEKRFDRFGWKGKYQFKDMVEYGLSSILADKVDQEMSEHEEDENYHPLGRVSIDEGDDNYIGNKLLYKDLSNLDPKREENMFPDQVKWLPSHGAILNGCYRIYGNKIVEYDIIFKFGSDNEDQKNDSIFQSGSYIVANDVEIKPYSGVGEGYGRQDNVKYFKNTWDMDIFSHKNEEKKNYSQMGLLRQTNRNDFVNTYSAHIMFPMQFIDRNYMIFTNTMLSQGFNGNVVQSQNDFVFCDKTRESVTVLNITFPPQDNQESNTEGFNTQNNGLISNSFHMKVIGRLS